MAVVTPFQAVRYDASRVGGLAKVIALRRKEAECLGYVESPYDALLENYEPGARASQLIGQARS